MQIDHDMFGKFVDETIGPDAAKRKRAERRRGRTHVTAQEQVHADGRKRHWQRDPQVISQRFRQQQPDQQRGQVKELIQRVIDRGLPVRV
jgi:hypothetical protein